MQKSSIALVRLLVWVGRQYMYMICLGEPAMDSLRQVN